MTKHSKSPNSQITKSDEARALNALQEANELLRAEVAYLKKWDALARAAQQAAPKKRKP
ncbi:hypothetical protein [Paludibacterium sp. B53371]|uniref:hypothetical protein n=1 Tax=Paludibacterium sp. B53371 TaxID=2806263 RepID=UPI0035300C17